MDKKIGILTLSASDNCGSLLQCFALQEYMKNEFDADVKIINFISKQSQELYSLFPSKLYKHPKKLVFGLKYYSLNKKQKRDYAEYRYKRLSLTSKIYQNIHDLENIDDDYAFDMIITGSDQIWNVYMTDFSECFFLPIKTKAIKIAYAASLGGIKDIPTNYSDILKTWINNFKMISVRELSGARTLSSLTEMKIPVLCDPTFLFGYDFWIQIAEKKNIDKPYIFFYSWAYGDIEMNKIVERFAKEKNLSVFVINSSKWYKYRPEDFGFILYSLSGPDVFLNLMAHAEYVFVQSFHGIAFANLLKKRFFFLNEQVDQIDFRAWNLIKLLHEEKQIVHDYADIENALNTELSYTSEELECMVARSKEYLRNAIKGIEE